MVPILKPHNLPFLNHLNPNILLFIARLPLPNGILHSVVQHRLPQTHSDNRNQYGVCEFGELFVAVVQFWEGDFEEHYEMDNNSQEMLDEVAGK